MKKDRDIQPYRPENRWLMDAVHIADFNYVRIRPGSYEEEEKDKCKCMILDLKHDLARDELRQWLLMTLEQLDSNKL